MPAAKQDSLAWSLDSDGNIVYLSHFRSVENVGVLQIGCRHFRRVIAPKELLARNDRRYTEDTKRDRFFGIRAQGGFHLVLGDKIIRVTDIQSLDQFGPVLFLISRMPIGPNESKYRTHDFGLTAKCDSEPQGAQWIKGMRRGRTQRNTLLLR